MKDEPTLVLFSGDAFSPSNRKRMLYILAYFSFYLNLLLLVSILLKGKQMVEILNECSINVACVGNHDFGIYFCVQTY